MWIILSDVCFERIHWCSAASEFMDLIFSCSISGYEVKVTDTKFWWSVPLKEVMHFQVRLNLTGLDIASLKFCVFLLIFKPKFTGEDTHQSQFLWSKEKNSSIYTFNIYLSWKLFPHLCDFEGSLSIWFFLSCKIFYFLSNSTLFTDTAGQTRVNPLALRAPCQQATLRRNPLLSFTSSLL